MPTSTLDDTFHALADPTRRAIIGQLRQGGETSLGDLAKPFKMSLPGVMKHVSILENAGLLERQKIGRTVYCRLNAAPMAEAIGWLQEMERFWSQSLDALADFVEQDTSASPSTKPKPKRKK